MKRVDFILCWPGQQVLLVWGSVALNAVRNQNRGPKSLPKPQRGDFYGIVCFRSKASTVALQQLYGGEPVLVVNAEKYSYKEMSMLHQGQLEKRIVYVSQNFPYWHHSFRVEAEPLGFKDTEDSQALQSLCSFCLTVCVRPCVQSHTCGHNVCFLCEPFNYSLCYHSSHKKEYFVQEEHEQEDMFSMDLLLCYADECTAHVDSQIFCSSCQLGGYCSLDCLLKHHVC